MVISQESQASQFYQWKNKSPLIQVLTFEKNVDLHYLMARISDMQFFSQLLNDYL